MFSDETNVRALLQKVLGYSQADQTEVVYLGTESALTRFANNSIHQNVAGSNHELRVRAGAGKRVAVANSLGIFAYEPRTDSECHAVVMADQQGSGYTQRIATDATTLDFEAMAREAVDKAQRSRKPVGIALGEYQVVLDTYAVGDMLQNLIFMGLSATAVQEE